MATSVEKGQRVIVTGRVRIRDWESGEKSGTTIEIDAESIGHDLAWGRATFTRSVISAKPEGTDESGATTETAPDAFAAPEPRDDSGALSGESEDGQLVTNGATATPF